MCEKNLAGSTHAKEKYGIPGLFQVGIRECHGEVLPQDCHHSLVVEKI